jgi:hypothetical protein
VNLEPERFRSILDGSASDLSSQERLIRYVAIDAERKGVDPRLAVEAEFPALLFSDRKVSVELSSRTTTPLPARTISNPHTPPAKPTKEDNQPVKPDSAEKPDGADSLVKFLANVWKDLPQLTVYAFWALLIAGGIYNVLPEAGLFIGGLVALYIGFAVIAFLFGILRRVSQ